MNSEKNIELAYDDAFTLNSIMEYVHENLYGLILLALTFVIIYFVDYISRINAMIFAMPSSIPGMPAQSSVSSMVLPKGKIKKVKKR
jgi:hypothetical protein